MKQLSDEDYQELIKIFGNPASEDDKHQMIFHEVKRTVGLEAAMYCSEQVRLYFKDKNPYRIKLLFLLADFYDFKPTPTMVDLGIDQHKKELAGEARGTLKKILKEEVDSQTYKRVKIMLVFGYSLKDAANKAAKWRKDNHPSSVIKASSIIKSFTKMYPESSEDREMALYIYQMLKDDGKLEGWRAIIDEMPMLDEFSDENDLIGTVR